MGAKAESDGKINKNRCSIYLYICYASPAGGNAAVKNSYGIEKGHLLPPSTLVRN